MTARLLETNKEPLEKVDVDGVTVDIIENALRNAREEMDAVLFRTAMSPGIREQGDCFPMIANKDGKMVVGQFGSFIGPFLEAYNDEIEEGDIILTNDPYMCNAAVSHLPDWVCWCLYLKRAVILPGRPCSGICPIMAAWCRARFPSRLPPSFRKVFVFRPPSCTKKVCCSPTFWS